MKNFVTVMYDTLAPEYRQYSLSKKTYLQTIDLLVIKNSVPNARNLLDVGAGDGIRGMSIARKLNISDVTLTDPSPEMVKLCRKLKPRRIAKTNAQSFKIPNKFDMILCLWNVLGHIETESARVKALSNLGSHLSKDGMLFLDVNNGCNIANYGLKNSLIRLFRDTFFYQPTNGDVSFKWDISGKKIPAKGHLFSPHEMSHLIAKSDLTVLNRCAVNYQTGEVSYNPYQGQLFYVLQKRK